MKKTYTECLNIQEQFEEEINNIQISQPNPLPAIEKGLLISRNYINRLREHVHHGCISSAEDEIKFFKFVKPVFVGYFLYFFYLQKIENGRPKGLAKEIKKYLQEKTQKSNEFLHLNRKCYYHFQRNDIKHDEQCFIRCNIDPKDYNYHPYSMLDSDFATSKDYLFADFKAHEMLIDYLCKEIKKLNENQTTRNLQSSLEWTASQIDLAELLYSLKISKSVNDGKIDIKELASILCAVFNVEKFNIYRAFVSIKNRQKEKVVFLDHLKSCLQRKIDTGFK